MRKSKGTQPEGDPLMEPTGNSGNFSPVSTARWAPGKATYDTLNARETKAEFKHLHEALEDRASKLAEARTPSMRRSHTSRTCRCSCRNVA